MSRAFRVSGAGNDFLALTEPTETPSASTIRNWCRRGLSFGADGLFVLARSDGGVRMDHFNADGRRAELCVNGARCAARLAVHLGWTDGPVRLLTDAGMVEADASPDGEVELRLEPPTARSEEKSLEIGSGAFVGRLLTVGVPHLIVEWPTTLADAPVDRLGADLRAHPALMPAGANVDFVRFRPPHRLEIRTFERGVEGETLACGSGVLAATAVALETHRLELPVCALTRGGFELTVDGRVDEDGAIERWAMAGDARVLGELQILDDADRLPSPPAWASD